MTWLAIVLGVGLVTGWWVADFAPHWVSGGLAVVLTVLALAPLGRLGRRVLGPRDVPG